MGQKCFCDRPTDTGGHLSKGNRAPSFGPVESKPGLPLFLKIKIVKREAQHWTQYLGWAGKEQSFCASIFICRIFCYLRFARWKWGHHSLSLNPSIIKCLISSTENQYLKRELCYQIWSFLALGMRIKAGKRFLINSVHLGSSTINPLS